MRNRVNQAPLPRALFQAVAVGLMAVLAAAGVAAVLVGIAPAVWLVDTLGSKLAAGGVLALLGAVVATVVVLPFRTFTDLAPLGEEFSKVGGLVARGELIESVRAQGDELERTRMGGIAGQRQYDAIMALSGVAVSLPTGVVLAIVWDFAPSKVIVKVGLALLFGVLLTLFYLARLVWTANRVR